MLLDLIGQAGLDALVAAMAECRLVHLDGACRTPADRLFSSEDLEQLLLRDSVGDCLTVMVNGRPVNLDRMGVLSNGDLRPLALRNLTRQGASLILNHLDRHLPSLWKLACEAERLLQDRVRILAVASYSRLPALIPHYDPWDLIIIQVDGTKKWNLFGRPANCARNFSELVERDEISATVTMNPGDVLLVPAGLSHQCEAEGYSLHLSLAVERATLNDLVKDLFDRHPSLNRPLRAVLGGTVTADQVAELGQELSERLAQVDAAAWLAEWNAARSRVTRLDLAPPTEPLDPDRLASLALTMTPAEWRDGQCQVGGARFEITSGARAVIEALRNGPRRVSDLIELAVEEASPGEGSAELERLIGKGIVQLERANDPLPSHGGEAGHRHR